MSKVDWEAIETEYRTGRFSNRELARRFDTSEGSIRRRASKHGWEKDLTQQVRVATRAKSKKQAVTDDIQKKREEAGEDLAAPLTDSEIIEAAAEHGAAVIQQHQSRIAKLQGIADKFASMLEKQVASDTITVMTRSGDTAVVDTPLDYIGKSLANGAMALQRLVDMERQAHGLDDDPNKGASADVKSVLDLVMGDSDGLPGA